MAALFNKTTARRSQALLQCVVHRRRKAAETLVLGDRQQLRHCHTQILWEALLGRKLEPGAAKKLDDAFVEYKVAKSVPSWLPFIPNSSFWIPSTEETVKSLQGLAKRVKPAASSIQPSLPSPSNGRASNIQPGSFSSSPLHSHATSRSLLKKMDNLLTLEKTGSLLEIRVANGDISELDDLEDDVDDIDEDDSDYELFTDDSDEE